MPLIAGMTEKVEVGDVGHRGLPLQQKEKQKHYGTGGQMPQNKALADLVEAAKRFNNNPCSGDVSTPTRRDFIEAIINAEQELKRQEGGKKKRGSWRRA